MAARRAFIARMWDASEDNGALVMRLESPEGDAGFPGNVTVQVRYTLDDDGTLTIAYEAITDAATPLNLTSHPYFNLTGRARAPIFADMCCRSTPTGSSKSMRR